MPTEFIVNRTRITTPGLIAAEGGMYASTYYAEGSLATAQAVATGSANILIPSGTSYVRITAAAATTGATLPVGSYNGQLLFITITTAALNTVTFAAAGTSNVAGGTTVSMAGLNGHMFIWDNVAALWFQVGPATN